MKASELRIGNYATINHPQYPEMMDMPLQVIGIEIDNDALGETGLVTLRTIEQLLDEDIIPIPITEDWLLKFGFEHHLDEEIWNHENICISYMEEKPDRGFKLYANHEYEIGAPFKFVHQLQNLYFAMTGEELEIKP